VKRNTVIALVTALVMCGCAWLSIARYDPALDSDTAKLHRKLADFFDELRDTAGTPEGAYERSTQFYFALRMDLGALRIAAQSQPGRERTLLILESIDHNLDELEAIHQDGVSAEEVAIIAQLFDAQFRMLAQLESMKRKDGPAARFKAGRDL
jgi:hypothetical protein